MAVAHSSFATYFSKVRFEDVAFLNNLEAAVDKARLAVEATLDATSLNREDTRANVVGGYILSIVTGTRRLYPKAQADKIAGDRITDILLQYPDALAAYKRFAELNKMPTTLAKCEEVEMTLAARSITRLTSSAAGGATVSSSQDYKANADAPVSPAPTASGGTAAAPATAASAAAPAAPAPSAAAQAVAAPASAAKANAPASAPLPTSGRCAYGKCGNMEEVVARCSACKLTFYCGPGCQSSHWKTHKKVCQKQVCKE